MLAFEPIFFSETVSLGIPRAYKCPHISCFMFSVKNKAHQTSVWLKTYVSPNHVR